MIDAYKIYLFVNIIDDSGGTTVYNITTPVIVTSNNALANNLASAISSNDPASPLLTDLNSGNLNLVAKNVIALSSVFNIQSTASQTDVTANTTLDQNNQMAALREFFMQKVVDLSVSDISSIKVISSALSATTGAPQQVSSSMAVNETN